MKDVAAHPFRDAYLFETNMKDVIVDSLLLAAHLQGRG